MIKGHHSLLLRQLFSTSKKHRKNIICPRKIMNSSKISPVKCYATEKDKTYCACKRRRKDIDKIKYFKKNT